MKRFEKYIKKSQKSENGIKKSKYYGDYNFEIFEKEGVINIEDYEPFQILKLSETIISWFNENGQTYLEKGPFNIMVTLPDTLFSLDTYMEKELDNKGFLSTGKIPIEGLNKNFRLQYTKIHYPQMFIFDLVSEEVKFLFFKKSNIKEIHEYYFTSKIFADKSRRGMA